MQLEKATVGEAAKRPSLPSFVGPSAMAALTLALFAYLLLIPMNWDSAAFLVSTSRWLHGAQLYRDIPDINPPLIHYETAALTAGLCSKPAFLAGTCLVMLFSALWCRRLRGDVYGLAALVALAVSGVQHFGQRDHLAIIFMLPYLSSDGRRSRAEQVLLALFAFLGVGLKPHFVAMAALASLASAIASRSIRPIFTTANWTLGIVYVVYGASIFIVYPAYFSEMVPAGRDFYFAFDAPLLSYRPLVWLSLIATVLAFYRPDRFQLRLAGALVGALISYFVQGKGFPYQAAPAVCLAMIVLAGRIRPGRDLVAIAAAILLAAFIAITGAIGPYRSAYSIHLPPGTSVLVLSDRVSAAYPAVVEEHLNNVAEFPSMAAVPGAVVVLADPKAPADRKARLAASLDATRQRLLRDVSRGRPDYILADREADARFRSNKFDWYAWLAGKEGLPQYVYQGPSGLFSVYRRAPDAPPAGR